MIVNDRTSPGEIEEILKKFHGTKYISALDTVCGYWQVELHPNSRKYLAFLFDWRNYQFKRLPFGLINSVAVFVKCCLLYTSPCSVKWLLDLFNSQSQLMNLEYSHLMTDNNNNHNICWESFTFVFHYCSVRVIYFFHLSL